MYDMHKKYALGSRGFTLIELLVVIRDYRYFGHSGFGGVGIVSEQGAWTDASTG